MADVLEHGTVQEKSKANDVQIIATQKKKKKKKRKYYVSSSSDSLSSDTDCESVLSAVNKRRKKMKEKKSENDQKQKNQKTKWSNDEISRLIDLYEAQPCLWDVFTSEYHNRETTSKAKTEIEVGCKIFSVLVFDKNRYKIEKQFYSPSYYCSNTLAYLDLFYYF